MITLPVILMLVGYSQFIQEESITNILYESSSILTTATLTSSIKQLHIASKGRSITATCVAALVMIIPMFISGAQCALHGFIWPDWVPDDDVMGLALATSTLASLSALLIEAHNRWIDLWSWVVAVEDQGARYSAMTVKLLCPDGVVRDFLFDTGAAASLLPHSMFIKACTKMRLRPSRLRLRAANGQIMPSMGVAKVGLRLPGASMSSPAIISHEFELLPNGAMPSSLHIRGVDFKVPLRVDDCLEQGDKDSVYSIHTLVPDYMWGNVITDVEHQTYGVIGWHLMQNPSKTETVSFPAGLQVATITQHKSMEEYLKQSGRDEIPSWVSLNCGNRTARANKE